MFLIYTFTTSLKLKYYERIFVRANTAYSFYSVVRNNMWDKNKNKTKRNKKKTVQNKRCIMTVIKRCYTAVKVLLMQRVQSYYYLKRYCGATKRMSELGSRLEYHSDGNIKHKLVNAWTRCVFFFSLPMQIDAWETYSDFVRNNYCCTYRNVQLLRNRNV